MKATATAILSLLLSGPACAAQAPYLERLASESDFDSLSTASYRSGSAGLPEVLFVADTAEDKIYYLNSSVFPGHLDFMSSNYLTSMKANMLIATELSLMEGRRFALGFLVRLEGGRYAVEFWRDSFFSADLLQDIMRRVDAAFFKPAPLFRPASPVQAAAARKALQAGRLAPAPSPRAAYELLSPGEAVGRLKIVDEVNEKTVCGPSDIMLTRKSMRYSFCIAAGAVSAVPVTALSHYVLIMQGLGIPSASIPGADARFRHLDGKKVYFSARAGGYTLRAATPEEERRLTRAAAPAGVELPSDPGFRKLLRITEQRAADSVRFGAKSANLGEVANSGVPGIAVPEGFSVPFYYYGRFIRDNGLAADIRSVANEEKMRLDDQYRKRRLEELRAKIEKGHMVPELTKAVELRLARDLGGAGVFVRSSTNSEDLPNFTGAGLYTTVPNAVGTQAVLDAIKTVWASIWNERAYEARERFGIRHETVMSGAIIQRSMNPDSAGVALADPAAGSVRLAAKKGLGIRVVEGNEPAENWLFLREQGRAQKTADSEDNTALRLSPSGGVSREAAEGSVLSEAQAQRISSLALGIAGYFGTAQDIEWLIEKDVLYTLQSRPLAAAAESAP